MKFLLQLTTADKQKQKRVQFNQNKHVQNIAVVMHLNYSSLERAMASH